MEKEEVNKNLDSIFLDYYEGLYNERQIKLMLLKLYNEVDIEISKWSEMILDAQWKYASEEDYIKKRLQLIEEEQM